MYEKPAGFWIRFGASLIDTILLAIVGTIIGLISIFGWSSGEGFRLDQILIDGVNAFYYILLPVVWYGYTVGKRATDIRIVKKDGTDVTFWTMIKRHLLAGLIYASPLIIGMIIGLFGVGKEFVGLFVLGEEINVAGKEEAITIASIAIVAGAVGTILVTLASGIMVGVRKDKRSIHDFIAGTYVTCKPAFKKADSETNDDGSEIEGNEVPKEDNDGKGDKESETGEK